MMLTATERNSLDLVDGVNAWDIPIEPLRRVNSFPPIWQDGGRWRVQDAKIATHETRRYFRRDRVTRRALLGAPPYEVVIPTMVRSGLSPEWEVASVGRTVCFVDKASFPTPDHAVLYALASLGWRIIP